MRARFRLWLDRLRASLWFLPTVGVLAAIGLSWACITLDSTGLGNWLQEQLGLYPIDPTGARLILSTIAGSMMTIASLVFSTTVLTLTVASQQMGPRLLEWFMSDRVNQSLMSYFVSLFVFALLGIGSIGDRTQDPLDPSSAYLVVIVSIVLTVFGIIALIVFVHRTATSIQTDSAIARTAAQLEHGIHSHMTVEKEGRPQRAMPEVTAEEFNVVCREAGYVQTIDEKALVSLACVADGIIRMCCAPGQYLLEGSTLAKFEGDRFDSQLETEIRQQVLLGSKRTATRDDVIFNLRGVVEIALRALSPGINDPFTAIACIDNLTSAIALIMRREVRDPVCVDAEGAARLRVLRPSFRGVLDSAFDDIRAFGRDHPPVQRRLLEALLALGTNVADAEQRAALSRHLERVRHTIQSGSIEPAIASELLELAEDAATAISS